MKRVRRARYAYIRRFDVRRSGTLRAKRYKNLTNAQPSAPSLFFFFGLDCRRGRRRQTLTNSLRFSPVAPNQSIRERRRNQRFTTTTARTSCRFTGHLDWDYLPALVLVLEITIRDHENVSTASTTEQEQVYIEFPSESNIS